MSSRRVYRRDISGSRLTSFSIAVKETDLWIAVNSFSYNENLKSGIEQVIWNRRHQIESYLETHPHLLTALEPFLPADDAPEIVKVMARAGNRAGVGPMAAVAGVIAEEIGQFLLNLSEEVIVENGGDIFIKVSEPVNIGIYAGDSPLSGKLALQIKPGQTPIGVCTSSGTVGPSISFGRADAAIALSQSTPLADAVATALGNRVQGPGELETALEFARKIEGITGALLICGDQIAVWGDIELQKA